MGQLQGKVALITGSGRGQGLAAAKRFAAEEARIVVNDLDPASVKAAVDSIRAAGGEAVEAVGDVAVSTDVRRVLAVAKEQYGGLDILYNNAGIGYSATKRFGVSMSDIVSCTEEDWRRILDINIGGVFLFCLAKALHEENYPERSGKIFHIVARILQRDLFYQMESQMH